MKWKVGDKVKFEQGGGIYAAGRGLGEMEPRWNLGFDRGGDNCWCYGVITRAARSDEIAPTKIPKSHKLWVVQYNNSSMNWIFIDNEIFPLVLDNRWENLGE